MEEEVQVKRSFWAFIPSMALSDKSLSSTAKLILAEIYSLADENGVCYPSNKHFSEILGISETQVSKCISQLKKRGCVDIEIIPEKGNLRVLKINLRGIDEKLKRSYQKVKEGYCQKVKERNTYIENQLETQLENKIIMFSKENRKISSSSYGNSDINYLMEKFKEITELKKMDGSEKQNRRYCWLCIKKFNGKENVEKLLKIAVKFDFHKANLTSFKYLYYHGVKILNEFKEKVKHPTYIEIKNGKIVR